MKKFVVILLALAMMISGSALAAPEDFAGVWVLAEQNSAGAVCELFYLTEDGTVYYSSASYFGFDSVGRRFVGSWEETEEGVHIVYGNTSEAWCKLKDGCMIFPGPSGSITYYPAVRPRFDQLIADAAVSYVLPEGFWTVGHDLPAGKYRILARADGSGIAFGYKHAGEEKYHTEAVPDGSVSLFAYELRDGDTVLIHHGAAVLRREE